MSISKFNYQKLSAREICFNQQMACLTKAVIQPHEIDTLTFLEKFIGALKDTQSVLMSFDTQSESLWFTRLFAIRDSVKQLNKKKEQDLNIYETLSHKKVNNIIFNSFSQTFILLTQIVKECTKVIQELKQDQSKTSSQNLASFGAPVLQVLTPLQSVYSLTSQILKAIKGMIRKNSTICHSLSNSDLFIDDLLLLMMWTGCEGEREEKIFKNSIVIIEGILVSKNFAFNAKLLNNLTSFMKNTGHKELSHFLRILALLVLEVNDKQLFKVLLPRSGMTCVANHIVMNHALLLNQPDFLRKMHEIGVNMIEVIGSLMECRQESQIQETVEQISKRGALERSGICVQELLSIFVQSEFSARYRNLLNKKFIVEYCLKNSSLMELLFILQNLLTGRKKLVVQNELTSYKFVENVLDPLYDILFHRDFNVDQVVTEDEEDSQDICFTARIQLLRLIINFSDRDDDNTLSKSSFISPSEHMLLQHVEIPLILYLHSSHEIKDIQAFNFFNNNNNKESLNKEAPINFQIEQSASNNNRIAQNKEENNSNNMNNNSFGSYGFQYNLVSSKNPIKRMMNTNEETSVQSACREQIKVTGSQSERTLSSSPDKLNQQQQSQQYDKINVNKKTSFQQSQQQSQLQQDSDEEIDGIARYKLLLEQFNSREISDQIDFQDMIQSEKMKECFEELFYPPTCNKYTTLPYRKDRLESVIHRGLMHKIIDTLKKVDDNCHLRFWLGSCVEAFLRGSHWYLQLFVLETGLLYFLTRQYVLSRLTKVNNIQVTLDVLAELVKFNVLGVMYLNIVLIGEDWLKKVEKIMFKNIVDTNVFLRNLYLTYFKIEYYKQINKKKQFIQNQDKHNKLFKILCEQNVFKTLTQLIESVNEENMNIDNISCISSALVILIQQQTNNQLIPTLQKLNTYFNSSITLIKFQKVLELWLFYLQLKTREIYSLSYSTNINFYYFQQAIHLFNKFIETVNLKAGSSALVNGPLQITEDQTSTSIEIEK